MDDARPPSLTPPAPPRPSPDASNLNEPAGSDGYTEVTKRHSLYASVLNNVPVEIVVLDAQHRYLYCNPEAIKDDAIRAWIIGKDDFDYCDYRGLNVEVARRRHARFEEAVRERRAVSWEETFTDAQGDAKYHWRNLLPLYEAGELTAVLGYGRDVTERRRTQGELERSSRRIIKVLESITDAFFSLDGAWRFTYLNAQAERMIGRAKEALLGRSLWEVFPEAASSLTYTKYHDALRTGESVVFEQFYPETGMWLEIHAYPTDEGLAVYFQNVSERKHAEEELTRSSQRITDILESVSDIFFSFDAAWRFTYINAPAEGFLGRARGELLGESVWESFPELAAYDFHARCLEAVAEARPLTFEEYHPPTDRWFEVHLYPAREGLSVYLRDVSDRKWLERERREAQRELERQVKERTAALEKAKAELEQANEKLLHDAFHDELTGLANRALFMDRLGQAIERAKRGGERGFAVLFLDFDRFKLVNDSLGHTVGDALLVALSQRLRACVRPGDTVARLGGDEFTILLEDVNCLEGAVRTAERVQGALATPFAVEGHTLHSSASVGIVSHEVGYDRPEDVLRDADIAMYRAKALGRAGYQVFTHDMRARAASLLALETDLRGALRKGELEVFYQPIVSVETGSPVGFEALARWPHPAHGLVSPSEFIPIAEEAGLIHELDAWVLRTACAQVRAWQEAFPSLPPLTLSVNVSGQGFARADLAERVGAVLRDTGFDPRSLKLELTESVLMGSSLTANFAKLRALGVALHIDDFGTGYSSLSYLQRFPVDTLKIDRSFVGGMAEHFESAELVRTILAMAKNLNLKVTAEGVETAAQLEHLKALGCDYGQGYLFAKPLAAADVTAFMAGAAETVA